MIARITTHLPCTEDELWARLAQPRSLQYVAAPILGFRAEHPGAFEQPWEVGRSYTLKLYLLNVIPLGRHVIELEQLDREANTIVSRERGLMAPVWNHRITFEQSAPGEVRYTDEIEIKAGLLTPVVWLFAQFFYRHRQRRWKRLLLGA